MQTYQHADPEIDVEVQVDAEIRNVEVDREESERLTIVYEKVFSDVKASSGQSNN